MVRQRRIDSPTHLAVAMGRCEICPLTLSETSIADGAKAARKVINGRRRDSQFARVPAKLHRALSQHGLSYPPPRCVQNQDRARSRRVALPLRQNLHHHTRLSAVPFSSSKKSMRPRRQQREEGHAWAWVSPSPSQMQGWWWRCCRRPRALPVVVVVVRSWWRSRDARGCFGSSICETCADGCLTYNEAPKSGMGMGKVRLCAPGTILARRRWCCVCCIESCHAAEQLRILWPRPWKRSPATTSARS